MTSKQRVAIINGFAEYKKYTDFLCDKYRAFKYTPSVHKFNSGALFCSRAHWTLNRQIQDIVNKNDILHCISGSAFVILPYLYKNNITKKLILESPGVKFTTGTITASAGMSKTYDVPERPAIRWVLDNVLVGKDWYEIYMRLIYEYASTGKALVLHSNADSVSDIRGHENLFKHGHVFETGAHGRLFFKNDFNVVLRYLHDVNPKL